MSFLTAASDRSSSGSGVSGVSGASFSGASSFFSLSFWTALVLLAIHHLLDHAAHCAHKSLWTLSADTAGHAGWDLKSPQHGPATPKTAPNKKAPLPYAGRIAGPFPGSEPRSRPGAPGRKRPASAPFSSP